MIRINPILTNKLRVFFFPLPLEITAERLISKPIAATTPIEEYNFNFESARPFFKSYSQLQVDSINAILGECNKQGVETSEQVAYILATAWHESRLMPIAEWGSDSYLSKYDTGKLAKQLGNTPEADGDGQKFKGRGYVMITGYSNYKKYEDLLGIPLTSKPELAKEVDIAAFIIVHGMMGGIFTGVGLPRYINKTKVDYINSRRVVNGLDKAELIRNYAIAIHPHIRYS